MNEQIEVMYFHGKTVDEYRYTVSGIVEEDGDLLMGIAICSDRDQFDKAIGRTISSGRVLNQRSYGRGKYAMSLYSSDLKNEYHNDNGFPEKYFVGNEIKIFREYCQNLNHYTKRELQQMFRLLKRN